MEKNFKCKKCKTKILQLKISLKGIKPPIWRRILVEDSINFYQLHKTIQVVMGWTNSHLFEFDMKNECIGIPHGDYDKEVQDSRKIKLNQIFTDEKQRLEYTYDFGDCWDHDIFIEKILGIDDAQECPVCIAGKRACPPEDSGSVHGYLEMLEIQKNKNHPEYEEKIIDWLGEDFDSEEFDIEEVNRCLRNVFKGKFGKI